MEITVAQVAELPAHTHICVRYGDARRLAPFKPGEKLWFPAVCSAEQTPKYYTVDVLRKVGSAKVSLAGIQALGGKSLDQVEIMPLDVQGQPIVANLVAVMEQTADPKIAQDSKKHQVAVRARSYLEKHDVQKVLHEMFTKLLEALPSDPLAFMADFMDRQHEEAKLRATPGRDYASEPGLGETPLLGFASGTVPPETLPDLSQHHSLLVDILRGNPNIYGRLRTLTTTLGVSLARCIKPGIDCAGHELIKVAGAYAGDAECYDLFRELFDPLVDALHGGHSNDGVHRIDSNPSEISNILIDPTGLYAISATLSVRRNFAGIRFPSCCSREERRWVENIATEALLSLDGELKGIYLPLRGSESYPKMKGGMAHHQEDHLRKASVLLPEPDSKMRLSAGFGRHWPDARGVFMSEMKSFYAWCNEEDHLRFFARRTGEVDLSALWRRVSVACRHVEAAAEHGFCKSQRLGYLTACPSRLGTALRCTVSLKVPHLAAKMDLMEVCRSMRLKCCQECGSKHGNLWSVSNIDVLGVSEVEVLNGLAEGCARLVQMEQRLESGAEVYTLIPGCGEEPAPGFSPQHSPLKLPCLNAHHNHTALVLRENPAIYSALRMVQTSKGVLLAACIKPGIDNPGHPIARSPGAVAGDEECYSTFKDFFDPLILRIHGSDRAARTSADLLNEVDAAQRGFVTPSSVLWVRAELRRNLRGLRFPPCADATERRKVEALLEAAAEATASRAGSSLGSGARYTPLGDLDVLQQEQLRSINLPVPEPLATSRLAAGLGRGWPGHRGILLAADRDLGIWCNDEDHFHIVAIAKGLNLKAALTRVFSCADELLAHSASEGFAHDERLGILTVSPEILGMGLLCSVALNLTLLGARSDFQSICQALHVRGVWRGGVWAISGSPSASFLAKSGNAPCELLGACGRLVFLERRLEHGHNVDKEVRTLLESNR